MLHLAMNKAHPVFPSIAAWCNGVCPCLSLRSSFAPFSKRNSQADRDPCTTDMSCLMPCLISVITQHVMFDNDNDQLINPSGQLYLRFVLRYKNKQSTRQEKDKVAHRGKLLKNIQFHM